VEEQILSELRAIRALLVRLVVETGGVFWSDTDPRREGLKEVYHAAVLAAPVVSLERQVAEAEPPSAEAAASADDASATARTADPGAAEAAEK
jgi:hypothetical protein